VKVKLSLWFSLTDHHAMKVYWGLGIQIHAFLTFALDVGEWSASCPSHFTPRKRAPGVHWIESRVGPRKKAIGTCKVKVNLSLCQTET